MNPDLNNRFYQISTAQEKDAVNAYLERARELRLMESLNIAAARCCPRLKAVKRDGVTIPAHRIARHVGKSHD
ncbi:hypothetical protein PP899_gp54 [Agrobacterium phage Atu_ph08]|uniref:Uncharacterized protein n=1 Tax=Agrobacterium phage Atu_ph08 TaxID=2024265 RepID=A0A2L0V118_9CAUD|nr:hypothetical protein PP899_gp54 [Agrobacterium phage Atu_ph08]AUZ95479.1 hypothetical protein [Agrobacterium phage Atu_ph08]